MERRLVHIEDPSHVTMWTNEEQTGLLEERLCLIAHLLERFLSFVCHSMVDIVVLLHEASNGLQLGVAGFLTEGLTEYPRSPSGDQCVPHIDALLALGKDELEELIFDGL